MMVPTGSQVCQKQLLALMHKVREVKVNEDEIAEFLPAVFEELNDLTKQELIKRFASIEFNRFLDYYRNAPDLNQDDRKLSVGEGDRYVTGSRFFINLGKMDGLDPGNMLGFIEDVSGVSRKFIGKMELKGAYSFFEVEKDKAEMLLNEFKGVEYKGRQVRIEITERKNSDSRKESSGREYRKRSSGSSFKSPRTSEHKRRRY